MFNKNDKQSDFYGEGYESSTQSMATLSSIVDGLAIVVVTYKRQELLSKLLDSIAQLSLAPWRVIVVDNENSEATKRLIDDFAKNVSKGSAATHWPSGTDSIVYVAMQENTGGAGGFSAGVKQAYELGAKWFWLMDDDVTVLPDALIKLSKWMPKHQVIQGSRLDFDGGLFYWQYHFWQHLGIYNPFATAKFDDAKTKRTNTLCFEGGLFSREIVDKIGLPDSRFFLYWDDCVYGYLASQHADSVVVADVILQRSREIKNWEITGVRQLSSSSDTTRHCIMRNRGHMARYLQLTGDYNRFLFGFGTLLSFAKEYIRLIAIDRDSFKSGSKSLISGWLESRRIIHDKNWLPMWEIEKL